MALLARPPKARTWRRRRVTCARPGPRVLAGAVHRPPTAPQPPPSTLTTHPSSGRGAAHRAYLANPAQSSRDAALDEFMEKHYTNEKIARAIDSECSGGRGVFNIKFKGNNQVGTGWFHSREQYRAVLRLAFFTEDRVRPPTLNREAAPCTQALGSPAWRAQATVLRYPPPRSTGKVQGLPRVVQEGKP